MLIKCNNLYRRILDTVVTKQLSMKFIKYSYVILRLLAYPAIFVLVEARFLVKIVSTPDGLLKRYWRGPCICLACVCSIF